MCPHHGSTGVVGAVKPLILATSRTFISFASRLYNANYSLVRSIPFLRHVRKRVVDDTATDFDVFPDVVGRDNLGVPLSSGALGVFLALNICNSATVYGFGTHEDHPQHYNYYSDTVANKAKEFPLMTRHDRVYELMFIRELVKSQALGALQCESHASVFSDIFNVRLYVWTGAGVGVACGLGLRMGD